MNSLLQLSDLASRAERLNENNESKMVPSLSSSSSSSSSISLSDSSPAPTETKLPESSRYVNFVHCTILGQLIANVNIFDQ
jgi:hypothetical protein